jgi:3-dehydrosphinganine reductase
MIPHFKQRRRGHIVNVSSLAGVVGFIGYAAYAPSKFAIMGFSEVLRNELIPHNVKVSVLLPPDTDTPQLAMENQTKPPETKALSGKAKLMQPDDVAMALLQGMVAERFHIVPGGFDSKVPYLGIRYIPGILRWVLDRDLMKVVNQKTEG